MTNFHYCLDLAEAKKTGIAFAADAEYCPCRDVTPVLGCCLCIELFPLPLDFTFARGWCLRQGLLLDGIDLESCRCYVLT